jgi:serine/threonine protein kinase
MLKNVKLGSGNYGNVYYGTVQCKWKKRLIPVAVKMIKCDTSSDNVGEANEEQAKQQVDSLRAELNILAYIHCRNTRPHPNIIRLIGAITKDDNEFYLMTEYCEYGSLDRFLNDKYRNNLFVNEFAGDESDRLVLNVSGCYAVNAK